MEKVQRQAGPSKLIHALAATLLALACAAAVDCPRIGALNAAQVLGAVASMTPRIGLKSFPQTLPLRYHEVVLTLVDGPGPPTTRRANCCNRAALWCSARPLGERLEPDEAEAGPEADHQPGSKSPTQALS